MKKGDIVTGKVVRTDFPNKGILTVDGEDIQVKNLIPGQTVEVRVTKKRKKKMQGMLLNVVEKSELETAKVELDEAQTLLDEKRVKSDELLKELLSKAEELEELYEQWEQEESDVLKEIAQKEKEYNEAKNREWAAHMATATTAPKPTQSSGSSGGNSGGSSSSSGSSSSGGGSSSSNAPASSGSWRVPCSYVKLTSAFGYRDAPTAGASTYHQGVDLAGPEGTPIYAARGGTVTTATFGKSAGYYVTINHGDGFSSVYMHMTHYVVSKGAKVSQGQLIGYMGSTGVSTGNHLHFGISYNGQYVNPANYIAFR